MKRPTRRPNSRSSESIIRAVEVLPLVPATRITGYGALRVAEQVQQRPDPVERRVDLRLGPPGEERRLDLGESSSGLLAGSAAPHLAGQRLAVAGCRVGCGGFSFDSADARLRNDSVSMDPGSRTPRVPEKPTVDGLEDALGAGMGGAGHLPLRPDQDPRADLLHRHAAAHGQRVAARRPRLLLHPHRHHRPLPADARARGLLPDGLGRQRPAHRAPGAELLRRPLRPVAALRPRLRRRRRSPTPSSQVADLAAATSSSCASGSPPRTSRRSRRSGAGSACRSTGR